MKKKYRIEKDTIGSIKVGSDKLWGAQTQRSLLNFSIGQEKMPVQIIKSLGHQKKAAAMTNLQLGNLESKLANAIIKSCNEIISLK